MARALDRRTATIGKTRSCPHCRATILESAAVCPACRHHLRFESRRGAEPEQASQPLKISGPFARASAEGPGNIPRVAPRCWRRRTARKGSCGRLGRVKRRVDLSRYLRSQRSLTEIADMHLVRCAATVPMPRARRFASTRVLPDCATCCDRPGEGQRIMRRIRPIHRLGCPEDTLSAGRTDLSARGHSRLPDLIEEAQADSAASTCLTGRALVRWSDSRRLFLSDSGQPIELHHSGPALHREARDGAASRVSERSLRRHARFYGGAERRRPRTSSALNEYFSILSAVTREPRHGMHMPARRGDSPALPPTIQRPCIRRRGADHRFVRWQPKEARPHRTASSIGITAGTSSWAMSGPLTAELTLIVDTVKWPAPWSSARAPVNPFSLREPISYPVPFGIAIAAAVCGSGRARRDLLLALFRSARSCAGRGLNRGPWGSRGYMPVSAGAGGTTVRSAIVYRLEPNRDGDPINSMPAKRLPGGTGICACSASTCRLRSAWYHPPLVAAHSAEADDCESSLSWAPLRMHALRHCLGQRERPARTDTEITESKNEPTSLGTPNFLPYRYKVSRQRGRARKQPVRSDTGPGATW